MKITFEKIVNVVIYAPLALLATIIVDLIFYVIKKIQL